MSIEVLRHQLHILRQAQAAQPQDAMQIEDSVKRHLRIVAQKPHIGRLALSIANLEAAIADQAAKDRISLDELPQAVDMLHAAAEARPPEKDSQPRPEGHNPGEDA